MNIKDVIEYMERSKFLFNFIVTVMLLILTWLFYLFVSDRVNMDFPEICPEDGILDARNVSFQNTIYHVVNNWDYYPGELYWPEDFRDPDNQPQKELGNKRSDQLGTHRIRIYVKPRTYLEIASYSIDYGMRIFVNGEEVRNLGYVSADPEKAKAGGRYLRLPLYSGDDGEIEIIYQYSNYMHNDGGFIQATVMSTPENIDEYVRGLSLNAMLTSCGLLFLSFYFLISALYQKSNEYTSLAFCCFIIAFRNHFFFMEHLLTPKLDFLVSYRLLILFVSLIPTTAVYLIAAFYPKVIRRVPVIIYTIIFFALVAAHFICRTQDLVALCHYSYYVCVPYLVYAVIRFVWYFWKKARLTVLELVTLTAIFFLIVVMILEGLNTGSNSRIAHFGLTPFGSFVSSMLLSVVINIRIQKQANMLMEERHKNEVLGQVNAVNKEFLRTVAHELRTPLTVISGYAQLMERQMEKNAFTPQTPERLEIIRSEADRLGNIVTKLMDYTYGNNDTTEFRKVDPAELLHAVEAVLTPICEKKLNVLEFENHCTIKIHANYELLLQVLINLVVNANRYTEKGTIKVSVNDGAGFAEFLVSDTGSGISAEDAPHVFERGYTTGEGKGIGLSICLETIRMHGGSIELAASGPDGTTFRFTVPKEKE